MPLPLAPLVPIALRLGAFAAAGWALRRALSGVAAGRTDQRAEDALDDLAEGVAFHRPGDRAGDGLTQTNAAGRFRRTIRWGSGGGLEVDATLLARLRVRRVTTEN